MTTRWTPRSRRGHGSRRGRWLLLERLHALVELVDRVAQLLHVVLEALDRLRGRLLCPDAVLELGDALVERVDAAGELGEGAARRRPLHVLLDLVDAIAEVAHLARARPAPRVALLLLGEERPQPHAEPGDGQDPDQHHRGAERVEPVEDLLAPDVVLGGRGDDLAL